MKKGTPQVRRCAFCGARASVCRNVHATTKGAWHVFCIYCDNKEYQWATKRGAINAWNGKQRSYKALPPVIFPNTSHSVVTR